MPDNISNKRVIKVNPETVKKNDPSENPGQPVLGAIKDKGLLPEKEEVKKESFPIGDSEELENKENVGDKDWKPKSVKSNFLKKVAPILIVLSFVSLGLVYYKKSQDNSNSDQTTGPLPTIPPFQPQRPSVYANDPFILQLEENINVLDRELLTSQLKENLFELPTLDFEVSFEK